MLKYEKPLQNKKSIVPLVMVIGALAAICSVAYYFALPQYRNYQVQKKISEVLVSANACRAEIAQVVQKAKVPQLTTSLFFCDGGASSGVKISPYLKSIAVGMTGSLTVTLDARSMPELTSSSNILTLMPMVDATHILGVGDGGKRVFVWRCGHPADGTTIPSQYLPSACRG